MTDPHLIVRAASIYVAVVATAAAWAYRRPSRRELTGALLSSLWNIPALLVVNVAAMRLGWWRFDADGGLLLEIPVDLYLAWAVLWGAAPALAFPTLPIPVLVVLAFAVDLIGMPLAAPVVELGANWVVGEVAALSLALVPGLLLARWTAMDRYLERRVVLQVVAFTGLVLFVLPAAISEGTGQPVRNIRTLSTTAVSLWVQLLAFPAVIGISAVQEFASRGRGTPVPFDPPTRLVVSGIYAYIRNPMQLSGVLALLLLGIFLRNPWLAAAGVMAHIYSVGLAAWDEDADLRERFSDAWTDYARGVRKWVPHWLPWFPAGRPLATLYVSDTCPMCRDTAAWLRARQPRGLTLRPAEEADRALDRVTYSPGDGTPPVYGVEAIARALEHINLGWALVGCALRLPGVLGAVQLLADACGAEPRTCPQRPATPRVP